MKKLISKNPVELFKTGIRFAKGGISLNMSGLRRHGSLANATYTDRNGNIVFLNGKLTAEANNYLTKKYGKEYAVMTERHMRKGNIWDRSLKNSKYGGWRIDNGRKDSEWNNEIAQKALKNRKDIRIINNKAYMVGTEGKDNKSYYDMEMNGFLTPPTKNNNSATKKGGPTTTKKNNNPTQNSSEFVKRGMSFLTHRNGKYQYYVPTHYEFWRDGIAGKNQDVLQFQTDSPLTDILLTDIRDKWRHYNEGIFDSTFRSSEASANNMGDWLIRYNRKHPEKALPTYLQFGTQEIPVTDTGNITTYMTRRLDPRYATPSAVDNSGFVVFNKKGGKLKVKMADGSGTITIDTPDKDQLAGRKPVGKTKDGENLYLDGDGKVVKHNPKEGPEQTNWMKKGGITKHQRGAKFMGTGVQKGWTSSYGNNLWNGITADLKLALIRTGKFTDDSFKDARSLQTALNKYFAGNAATMRNRDGDSDSRIAVDNKWGDLSLKALMHALSMASYDKARPLNINNVNPVNAPLNGMSTIPTKIETRPEHTYNRTEVRQLLRNQGINPYSLSGALRQAIRFALNGGHEYNKALLYGIDLKKLTQPVTVGNNTLSVPNPGNILLKQGTVPTNNIPLPTIQIKDPGRIPTVPVAKLGGRLISKDPVKLFKLGGSIAKYGLGDRMLSYVKKQKSELNRAKAAANNWSGYELTYPEFTQNGIATKGVISGNYLLPEVTVKASKESARKSRLSEASKKNSAIAKMLDFLYKNKFFDNNVNYHTAVDGIIGDKTKNAMKKAQLLGYVIDQKTGKITRPTQSSKKQTKPVNPKPIENPRENSLVANLFNKVGNWFTDLFDKDTVTNNTYTPSNNKNLQAVIDHKINTGVTEPYFYVDKNKGTMYKLQGDKILLKFDIATGVNSGLDGWTTLSRDSIGRPVYDRSLNSSSTPAGVFTLGRKMTLYKEPAYRLIEAGTNRWTPSVVHVPATKQRAELLANGNHFLTYGCIQLPNGQTSCLGNPEGDTLYVEPSVSGNYLYEDSDGKIKTRFKDTSSTATGTVWGKPFSRNDVKYNTGY